MFKKELLSIIVPCFNEEESIPLFYKKIKNVIKEMDNIKFEILFVDDGSNDLSLEKMKELQDKDKNVKYISFSRNFGKEAAMFAGLNEAKGDYVAIMDVDLQDPPQLLKEMYNTLINENYDIVATRSVSRNGYSKFRKFCTKLFYKIINKISKTEMISGARDYRLMKRKVVDAVLSMSEYNRYTKGIYSFIGFKTKWITFENQERIAGTTKWSFGKLFKYALEGIIGYSVTPLMFAALFGIIFCLIALIMVIVIFVNTLIWGNPVSGWPSLACIIFFVGGIQLFCTGIIGIYLSKTYLETKRRPIYIISEKSE